MTPALGSRWEPAGGRTSGLDVPEPASDHAGPAISAEQSKTRHPATVQEGGDGLEVAVSNHLTRPAAARPEPSAPDLHYVAVTNALLDYGLPPRQLQLVITLLSYRWYETSPIIPSVRTLAERMHCSVRTVQYAMRGLVRLRLIEVQHTFRPDGGQMSNVYVIGPALAPLLTPRSTPAASEQHPPVQRPAAKPTERNYPNGTSKSQGWNSQPGGAPRDYFSTRRGDLRQR